MHYAAIAVFSVVSEDCLANSGRTRAMTASVWDHSPHLGGRSSIQKHHHRRYIPRHCNSMSGEWPWLLAMPGGSDRANFYTLMLRHDRPVQFTGTGASTLHDRSVPCPRLISDPPVAASYQDESQFHVSDGRYGEFTFPDWKWRRQGNPISGGRISTRVRPNTDAVPVPSPPLRRSSCGDHSL